MWNVCLRTLQVLSTTNPSARSCAANDWTVGMDPFKLTEVHMKPTRAPQVISLLGFSLASPDLSSLSCPSL